MSRTEDPKTIAFLSKLERLRILKAISAETSREDEILAKAEALFPNIATLTDLFASYMQPKSAYKRAIAQVKYVFLDKGFVRPLKRLFEHKARKNKNFGKERSPITESLEHASKYWWQREVNRPTPVEDTSDFEKPQQVQEAITDEMLNGDGGQFVVEMQADDSLDIIPKLLRSQLYNMIISRKNFDFNDENKKMYGESESGMTVRELPTKPYYTCVVRFGSKQKKFYFSSEEILDQTSLIFNEEFKKQLIEPSAWREFTTDSILNNSQAVKGKIGRLTRQEVSQSQIDDRNNFIATDVMITLRKEDDKEPLSKLYQPQFSNNGANCVLGLHFAVQQSGASLRVKKVSATSWHPQQDGAPLSRELPNSYAQAKKYRAPVHDVDATTVDEIHATLIESKFLAAASTASASLEKESSNEILEATIDAEALYARTWAYYTQIKDRWFMEIGEKKYGAEIPVYQLLLYAVMMTTGIESAHQLVVDKSTGAVVPNVVGMPEFVQNFIKKGEWKSEKTTAKKAREIRTSFLSLACLSKMDRSLINPDDGTFGTGLVRSTAVLVDKFRDTAKVFGKIFNNQVARLIDGTFLSSTLVPAQKKDLTEIGKGVGLTRFTTALSETHTKGGVGMTAYLEGGRAKVHLALRKGKDFPSSYKGDFESDVQKNLKILLEYYTEHLGKLSQGDKGEVKGDVDEMKEKVTDTSKRKRFTLTPST